MEGLAEGDLLAGRYRLGPVAGHGAMGEVHLAEDVRLARPVAIKSLRPELARYPEVRQRFGHEARAAARISHPNVVRVYDSGEEDGVPYLVMECLPGTSLSDELAWGPLDPRRARRVGLDVLGALDAAHRLGVVHRDVKPGNILLTATLDGPVKVSDFGIAKSADDGTLTDSGGLVGTAAYLAPERVAGEPAAPASDLYSLGVVLYEALAGRQPHAGETALALALAIHMEEAPSLGVLRPDLDPALVAIVDKALARDPADRWESAAKMAEGLRAWRPPVSSRVRAVAEEAGGSVTVAAVAAPTVALAAEAAGQSPTGRLPATSARGATSATALEVGPAGPGDALSRSRRRRRAGIAGVGAAGLLLVLAVGLATRRSPGRAEPGGPTTTVAVATGDPGTTAAPDSAATSTPPSTGAARRPTRRPATPVPTAAPTTRPAPTTAPVRTTTTQRPATTIPATTVAPTTPTT
ncbi:MAG: serine/threonine-protein kinase [Acidimicrobiales bacterium]